ncbi:SPFH domain-containing protein [Streptomyces albipurpureus]|uniref:SPFH domain-containing protein n=1 Tax=Streptomyces albipurpureus TaxID=2897419 RepID=UPI0027E4B430|nr:SPFH domain-containing protein [Streptomyces sp. CWNU-1]
MTTTTSEPEGDGSAADTPRHTPVIAQEATTEIPVHLLFRDDFTGEGSGPDGYVHGWSPPISLRPAVVARRLGTGEQPRITRPPLAPNAPRRPGPPEDLTLTERPGAVLSGWTGMVAGACALAGIGAVLWGAGALPERLIRLLGLPPHPYHGLGIGLWCLLTLGVVLVLFTLGGIGRGKVGHAWVLTLFGEYRGSVRRTGLLWMSPLVLRRRVDVRLRHWRSEVMPAVDAEGAPLSVVVLVVWRVRDTARAVLGVEDHEEYLGEQVEAAMVRVVSQLPADAFADSARGATVPSMAGGRTLRDAEAVGTALTRALQAECAAVGVEVFSAQPVTIEYAPEIVTAMRRRRIAAIDARHRDGVLTSVVDAVDETVRRLTSRGLVELDDYERKALVKDLTVAFYAHHSAGSER